MHSTVETDGSTQAYRLDSYSVVSEMFLRGDVFMIVISNLQCRGKIVSIKSPINRSKNNFLIFILLGISVAYISWRCT